MTFTVIGTLRSLHGPLLFIGSGNVFVLLQARLLFASIVAGMAAVGPQMSRLGADVSVPADWVGGDGSAVGPQMSRLGADVSAPADSGGGDGSAACSAVGPQMSRLGADVSAPADWGGVGAGEPRCRSWGEMAGSTSPQLVMAMGGHLEEASALFWSDNRDKRLGT